MTSLKKLTLLSATQITVLSFVIVSIIGGALLWFTESNRIIHAKTPILQEVTVTPIEKPAGGIRGESVKQTHAFIKDIEYKGESFIDAWFTAISALCVTGLTSTDFSQFTLAGQIITLILIQMGGLGIIVFTSLFAFAVVRGLSERVNLKTLLANILDVDRNKVVRMMRHVAVYTLVFEGLATIIMGIHLHFFVDPSILKGINPWWWALFHSISGFNNAGFSLMNNNLMGFVTDPVINLTIAVLIIVGGIGYPVLIAIHTALRGKLFHRHDKTQETLLRDVEGVVASPVQTKVALWGKIIFLMLGTFFTLTIESTNPVMKTYNFPEQLMINFFQSVSTRTAGFNTIDIGTLHVATLFLYIILMYIGANPAGTAGGIKIPTVATLYGYIKDWFKEPGQPVTLFKMRISKFAVSHAMRLFFFSILFIFLITILLCINERQYLITPDATFNFIKIVFEAVSAFDYRWVFLVA